MKMPFKDPAAPKQRKMSANFAAPTKTQATEDLFMPAGDDYGVGMRQPIGTEKQVSTSVVPKGARCDLLIK